MHAVQRFNARRRGPEGAEGPKPLTGGRISPPTIKAKPVRHPGQWVAAVILVLIVAAGIRSMVTNPRFEWHVVGHYLFDHQIVSGLLLTSLLTAVAMVIGVVLGTLLAVMRRSQNRLLRGASVAYVTFFRGTPVLVQVIFWFNLAALYPSIALGVPFGPALVRLNANTTITPLAAAILGLGLNEGAYMAEIVRAGINSVDHGQQEAAHALGMSNSLTLRRIVVPQAMRLIIPPTGNETITMLKTTAIVSVIGLSDLLYAAESIYTRTYQIIALLIVASIWYLVLVTFLSLVQVRIERAFSPAAPGSPHRSRGRLRLTGVQHAR
jgi:polar amino acid transport system permease protein